jgi:hypothetical protein
MFPLFFAGCLVAVSLGLMCWHVVEWRRADHGGLTDRDLRFFRHQYRRRMQASAILGIVGLLALVDYAAVGIGRIVLWSAILLLVLWAVLLALLDWLASRLHYDAQLSATAVEQALLMREIEKYRREQQAEIERHTSDNGSP